jgi:hypothetical protein
MRGAGVESEGKGLLARRRAGPQSRDARTETQARLLVRRAEIEQAVLTRVNAISGSGREADPAYLEGLRTAALAAIEYFLEATEQGERRVVPIPAQMRAQARAAARNAVSLDTVLRRCFGGYTLFGDFLIEEAAKLQLPGEELKRLLRSQAHHFDRLVSATSEEYAREAESLPGSSAQLRAELVGRLLDGELIDTAELAYDFDAHHLGLIAQGPGAAEALRDLAAPLDRRLLLVRREADLAWLWLGGRSRPDPVDLEGPIAASWPPRIALAIGEPGESLAGWRLSHRQAAAALPVAQRRRAEPVRYADVALLASILRDEVLAASLRQLYLEPLAAASGGGEVLRETLRAYFAAERNVSSAAAGLGVKRHTVTNRLRAVEERLGRPLDECSLDLDAALRLEERGRPSSS